MQTPDAIIDFWFIAHGSKDWWGADPAFDRELADRFGETHARIALGEGFTWRGTAEGRLAEIIVLDQFSRQLYRGSPKAFAQDGMALALTQEAVAGGFDRQLEGDRRMFLYMPYMHSESVLVHEAAVPLWGFGGEDFQKGGDQHLAVVRRFGRFPKRNAVLDRPSTPEELAYITEIGDRMF